MCSPCRAERSGLPLTESDRALQAVHGYYRQQGMFGTDTEGALRRQLAEQLESAWRLEREVRGLKIELQRERRRWLTAHPGSGPDDQVVVELEVYTEDAP